MTDVLVVTGGVSGIGREVIVHALASSPDLVAIAIDRAVAAPDDPLFSQERAHAVRADVTSPEQVSAAAAAAAEHGTCRYLVNAAGYQHNCPSSELAYEDWRAVLAVNLDGVFLCCQQFGSQMCRSGGGSIVNLCSVAMDFGWPRRAPYATAKAGVAALSRTLAVEWAEHDVRVNALAPGYVKTPLVDAAVARGELELAAVERMQPAGRLGTTAEVAAATWFLLSGGASFITGETLRVDGGLSVSKLERPDGGWSS